MLLSYCSNLCRCSACGPTVPSFGRKVYAGSFWHWIWIWRRAILNAFIHPIPSSMPARGRSSPQPLPKTGRGAKQPKAPWEMLRDAALAGRPQQLWSQARVSGVRGPKDMQLWMLPGVDSNGSNTISRSEPIDSPVEGVVLEGVGPGLVDMSTIQSCSLLLFSAAPLPKIAQDVPTIALLLVVWCLLTIVAICY